LLAAEQLAEELRCERAISAFCYDPGDDEAADLVDNDVRFSVHISPLLEYSAM
jgi:hypothetical protein